MDVEEFEPEIFDSSQQAVQGRLVGPCAPQNRRIAHHAHLRVVEDAPHPGTRDTADGDHIGTVGHICRLCHLCRKPLDGVSCLHPFRVCLPVVASGRDDPGPELGQYAGWDFRPWRLRARRDGLVMMVRRPCRHLSLAQTARKRGLGAGDLALSDSAGHLLRRAGMYRG